jgi:hypothetical protein
MVLNKEELIALLQSEIRILLHLAGKIDQSQLDYRPTAKQRSTLELLQYMAIMGPTQLAVIKGGVFDRPTMGAIWGPADQASKAMSFDQAIAAIEKQSADYATTLNSWTEADFREVIDMFGHKSSRGSMVVNLVFGAHSVYRMQLFGYLKSCGREELNTMNLWAGMDGAM